jgi:hypothetical protein
MLHSYLDLELGLEYSAMSHLRIVGSFRIIATLSITVLELCSPILAMILGPMKL